MNSLPLSESIPSRGNGSDRLDIEQGLEAPALCLVRHGPDLGPARGHAGQVQALAELPERVAPVVGHQVDLAEPGPSIVPPAKVRMGIWRFSRLPGLVPDRPRTCSRTRSGARDPIDRGSGDTEAACPGPPARCEISPHRSRASTIWGMNGARRLPAGPFKRGPDHPQRLEHFRTIDRLGRGGLGGRCDGAMACARARRACRRVHPVRAQSSSRILPLSFFEAFA